MDFLQRTIEKVKQNKVTIVLPESSDDRILSASQKILEKGICNLILIGNKDDILSRGFKLNGVTFIDPKTYDISPFVTSLMEIRKSKGLTEQQAKELLTTNSLYLGCMLVKEGIAHGMVAGAINPTGDVMRASLQILKTAPGVKLVSAFFVMVIPGFENEFIFADCGLVQSPTAEELASIAESSAKSYSTLFGKEALIAMLSHSTLGSAKHSMVTKVAEATKIIKKQNPNLKVDGELQLDTAIVPSVANLKAKDSPIAGKANVLIFPDVDSGNIGYKLVQRFAKSEAYGPIIQGLGGNVNDLSRGCSVEDIVGVVAITALQCQ